MMFLTREQIETAPDIKYGMVDVPEWGGAVRIRGLFASEVARINESFRRKGEGKGDELGTPESIICGYGIIDEHGVNVFTSMTMRNLAKRNPSVLSRISTEIYRLTGLLEETQTAIEKN
jgi:hypothetical protein